jgi:O-antigen/teichoic acid export membrane protein
MSEPANSRVGRNVAAMAGGQIVTWSMTLLWTLIVPRSLGPGGMGIIVAAWSVTGVLGVFLGLGTRNFVVREMVVREKDGPQLLGTAVVLRLLLSPLFIAAALIYAHVAGLGDDATVVLYLAVAATIFVQVAEPLQAAFQAIERMEYLAYSEVVSKSAQGLVGIAVALAGLGAIGITGTWAAMTGIVVVLNVVWLRRRMRIDLRTNLRRLREMIRESMAYWAFGLFFTVYLWIDALMLSLMTREEVVGWYGVPMKLFQTFMFVPVVIATAWLPRLVRTFVDEGEEGLRGAARKPVELVLVLGLPITAAMVVGAAPFVELVYGSTYEESVPVLIVLALCITPMYLNTMLSYVLVAAKRQLVWTWVMGLSTIINPLFNLVFIPLTENRYGNGAIGAGLSLLLTELITLPIGFKIAGWGIVDRALARRVGLAAFASAALWGVSAVTAPLGTVPSIAAGALVFCALVFWLRILSPDELRAARRMVAARLPSLRRRRRPEPAPAAD